MSKPLLVVAAVLAFAGSARATVTVDGTELPPYTNVTNQLALSHGVTLSSTMGFVTFGDNGVLDWGIFGTDPSFNPIADYAAYNAPIYVTFVSMINGVTPATVSGTVNAIFGDGGGDTDGIRVRAYDLGNNLIGTQTALTVTFGPISISGVGIHSLVFDQSGLGSPTSDTFLDSLSYPNPVANVEPEPASILLLGAAALVLRGRRRARVIA